MMSRRLEVFVCIIVLVTAGLTGAEIPQMISYQGKVTDSGGVPVPDGDYTMRFRIYDAASAGALEWDSGAQTVAVSGGTFEVMLGESPQPAITLEFDEDYWLRVTIAGDDQTPRTRLGSAGYAYMASGLVAGTEVIGSVDTGTHAAIKATNTSTADLTYGVYGSTATTEGIGVVGVQPGYVPESAVTDDYLKPGGFFGGKNGVMGISNVQYGFGVIGLSQATTGDGCGGFFKSDAPSGKGVHGEATATTGTNYGIYGSSSSNDGRGVYGYTGSTTGNTFGVYGRTASTGGRGVYGYASTSTGATYGVHGQSASTDGTGVFGYVSTLTGTTYGGRFESNSVDGTGVYGKAWATTGWSYGGRFESYATNGTGVYGYTSATDGTNHGVHGRSASSYGKGVFGEAPATTGVNYGVYGESWSTDGRGVGARAMAPTGVTYAVSGYNTSTSGRGVFGDANSGSGFTYGIYGRSRSNEGKGVYGEATATQGLTYGVYGMSASTSGMAIYGNATATAGYAYGVWAESSSPIGVGVRGETLATAGTSFGVYGNSRSTDGRGVFGFATASTGTNYGVRGQTLSTDGYGGYFSGDVHVSGTLSKTSGSFLIDHPLDPENKLLRHNFVESPENLLIYRGKIQLNEDGRAIVEMPEYFASLTKEDEATIHLTAEGLPFLTGYQWDVDYAGFTAFGEPHREISWSVMAERDDPSMRRLARPVEEEKGSDNKYCDQGKLLDPIAYGYPENMGRDYKEQELREPGGAE